jgi:hypothetical protein
MAFMSLPGCTLAKYWLSHAAVLVQQFLKVAFGEKALKNRVGDHCADLRACQLNSIVVFVVNHGEEIDCWIVMIVVIAVIVGLL